MSTHTYLLAKYAWLPLLLALPVGCFWATGDRAGLGGRENICGDGVAMGVETCDGADLRGMSCASLGFAPAPLDCTDACEIDARGCGTDFALRFDGEDDVVECANGGILDALQSGATWEAWIQFDGDEGPILTLMDRDTNAGFGIGTIGGKGGGFGVYFAVSEGEGTYFNGFELDPTTSGSHFLAITFTPGLLGCPRVYLDGVLQDACGSLVDAFGPTDAPLLIGGRCPVYGMCPGY